MNKTIILALILIKTIYTPQEDYEAAKKTLENDDYVYIDNKGKDNGEDNL